MKLHQKLATCAVACSASSYLHGLASAYFASHGDRHYAGWAGAVACTSAIAAAALMLVTAIAYVERRDL